VNATTSAGRGWCALGGRSTKLGLVQYGQVWVRTPANARLAPQWPQENVTACVATSGRDPAIPISLADLRAPWSTSFAPRLAALALATT
jgi:hypothetical protein